MLKHVLKVVAAEIGPRHTIVVSSDSEVLAFAAAKGLHTLRERFPRTLNGALRQAACYAVQHGARGVLTVFGDLPLMRRQELRQMLDCYPAAPRVVAAPDRAGTGTNALLVEPADLIDFQFGQHSFNRHYSQAMRRNCTWGVVRTPGLATDIDCPKDFIFAMATALRSRHGCHMKTVSQVNLARARR
jgi:2-phospho-L-lactate guanylyltransferase